VSYSAKLPTFKVPQLWISGAADYLAPNGMAKQAYLLSGASDKTYVDAGKASGFSADYGHGDILIGNKAQDEVYPIISNWLNAHSD
jgi:polyhydroxyalkanoate synthase